MIFLLKCRNTEKRFLFWAIFYDYVVFFRYTNKQNKGYVKGLAVTTWPKTTQYTNTSLKSTNSKSAIN